MSKKGTWGQWWTEPEGIQIYIFCLLKANLNHLLSMAKWRKVSRRSGPQCRGECNNQSVKSCWVLLPSPLKIIETNRGIVQSTEFRIFLPTEGPSHYSKAPLVLSLSSFDQRLLHSQLYTNPVKGKAAWFRLGKHPPLSTYSSMAGWKEKLNLLLAEKGIYPGHTLSQHVF